MSYGSEIAKSGYKTEELFSFLINQHEDFNRIIKQFLGISENAIISATTLKGRDKGDVSIHLPDGSTILASLKSTKANFSQLDRRWLCDLVSKMNMPQNVADALKAGLDSMRLKQGTYQQLILPQYSAKITTYFQMHLRKFWIEMFTRNDPNVKIFVVYDNTMGDWYLAPISNVISLMEKQSVTVSKKGVLKFGELGSMQRKGGDGNNKTYPKSDERHPGNQIQVKIKPMSIVNQIQTLKISF